MNAVAMREEVLERQLAEADLELETVKMELQEERKLLSRFTEKYVRADAEDHVILSKSKFDQLHRDAKAKLNAEAELVVVEQFYRAKLNTVEEKAKNLEIE